MTWQRIDENTYIDDSLVTCAEYQLFIDEMREQRKYYQPDHWTSYQFPEGQARKLILGVRHSDAGEFCSWLTDKKERDWRYRLPIIGEAREFSLSADYTYPVGYWLRDENRGYIWNYPFFWAGPVSEDPRGIKTDVQYDHSLPVVIEMILDLGTEMADAVIESLQLSSERAKVFRYAYDYASHRDLDHRASITSKNILSLSIMADVNIPHDDDFAERNALAVVQNYIDFYTLQERIAGRSPAFEGIRLVKERIR